MQEIKGVGEAILKACHEPEEPEFMPGALRKLHEQLQQNNADYVALLNAEILRLKIQVIRLEAENRQLREGL